MSFRREDPAAEMLTRIQRLPVRPPPDPWRLTVQHAIGGLRSVGFALGSELLLVASAQGRGVFDCRTGDRIARDRDEAVSKWEDPQRLLVRGIGPLEGTDIHAAGLFGGGLALYTSDGWHLEVVYHSWPNMSSIILVSGHGDLWSAKDLAKCHRIYSPDELRAYGFSESGEFLVLAESHTVTAYARDRG